MKSSCITLEKIKEIVKEHETPFVIYDKKGIQDNMQKFNRAFDWASNFKNYFAVKACPNPSILKILKEVWSWTDCSSLWELIMSEICGFTGEDIMFTSNNTQAEEFIKAHQLWAIINFDDITHIDFYQKNVWYMPIFACCRYNPGPLKKWNIIIGNPETAKYGMTEEQIFEAYKKLKDAGVKRFGLHTMVASNELNPAYFIETAKILFALARALEIQLWITFEFINLWWWIGIPYKLEQQAINLEKLSKWIYKEYTKHIWDNRDAPIKIFMECGRMITWPYGQLITQVGHITQKYKEYIWVDASMQCLMRPALYWAYHHIDIIGKEQEIKHYTYDVTGSLCENNDKFAIDRKLPKVNVGDYMVIYDAWAHGTSMWFNYNAKLRPAELLLQENGNISLIRRKETFWHYFSTIEWIDWFTFDT